MGNLSAAYRAVDAEAVGNALHQVSEVAEFDPELKSIQDQLYDAERYCPMRIMRLENIWDSSILMSRFIRRHRNAWI